MPAPFSLDLRQRVWAAYDRGEGTEAEIAKRFGVSASFVRDLVRRVRETGSPKAKPHGGGMPPALDAQGLKQVAEVVAQASDATLDELCVKLRREKKLHVNRTSLWRALQALRLTRKKERPACSRARHAPSQALTA